MNPIAEFNAAFGYDVDPELPQPSATQQGMIEVASLRGRTDIANRLAKFFRDPSCQLVVQPSQP